MKIAGVVILYNPKEESLHKIHSYLDFLDILYVLDNSETINKNLVVQLEENEKISYLQDGENKGIAERLNQVSVAALKADYTWLLTMDQDSSFPESAFKQYLNCIENFPGNHEVSMFGIEHEKKGVLTASCTSIQVQQLITSGSMLNLQLFDRIGQFDKNLFIDFVDIEYCYRSILQGYKIIQFTNIFLNHELGNLQYFYSLKNLKKTPRVLHSPLRMYYMIRNYLYLKGKYNAHFSKDIAIRKKSILIRLKNNFLYGSGKLLLIKYTYKAIHDFRNNKMGKINNQNK